jgi:hypothetical protein
MSLEKKHPQSYAPLRLKHNQLEPFFSSIRDRKVTRGYESDAVKVVTNSEFSDGAAFAPQPGNKTKRSSKKRKASPSSSQSTLKKKKTAPKKKSTSAASKRKSKSIIEKKLKNAKLQ